MSLGAGIRNLVSFRWMRSRTARTLSWERNLTAGITALREGQFDEARSQYLRALRDAEGFGPADPRLTVTLDNLGALYRLQGKYEEAEPICLRALAIKESTFGPEHANVASTLRDLNEIYRSLGQIDRARKYQERALKILEKAIGPDFEELSEALDKSEALRSKKKGP